MDEEEEKENEITELTDEKEMGDRFHLMKLEEVNSDEDVANENPQIYDD